jgi:hypothetical protein
MTLTWIKGHPIEQDYLTLAHQTSDRQSMEVVMAIARLRTAGWSAMLSVEFPNGSQIDFETPEALARAVAQIRAGTPIVVRSEKDGSRECCGRRRTSTEWLMSWERYRTPVIRGGTLDCFS